MGQAKRKALQAKTEAVKPNYVPAADQRPVYTVNGVNLRFGTGNPKAHSKLLEQLERIDHTPARRHEVDGIVALGSVVQQLEDLQEHLEKRLKGIPNGWTQYRQIRGILSRLKTKLLFSLPPEKIAHTEILCDHVGCKLVYYRPAYEDASTERYWLDREAFGIIADAAAKQCQTCLGEPGDCKRCDLGRTFDRITSVSRPENTAWWECWGLLSSGRNLE